MKRSRSSGSLPWMQLAISCLLLWRVTAAPADEFEDWKRAQQQAFTDYQTQEDKAFIAFLEAEWEAFQAFQGLVQDLAPKPASAPRIRNATQLAAVDRPSGKPRFKRTQAPVRVTGFYGHAIEPIVFPVKQLPDLDPPSNNRLARVWSVLSAADHSGVVAELQHYREKYALGDWGLLQLTGYLLRTQFSSPSDITAYTWFLLNRLGYDLRIGYTNQSVFLLTPTGNKIYGNRYVVISDTRYYMMPEPAEDTLRSYGRSSDQNLVSFDFTLDRLIRTSEQLNSLQIDYAGKHGSTTLSFIYDAGLSAFMSSYPQIDLPWYFSVAPGAPAADSMLTQLRPQIAELDQRAAINYLLHFTQDVFDYMTDSEQFGREKYLLAEESLHYGTNDCEDRSIFLAWLLNSLLEVELVALDYPGHVALAVRTDIQPGDTFISYQGRKYVVADPTYIGADAGMIMPAVANLTPQVINVDYRE